MAVTVLHGPDGVRAAVGRHLGRSDWLLIDQQRIDIFAEATGDHQWIQVDTESAASAGARRLDDGIAQGPFGSLCIPDYLTLSLSNCFLPQIVEVTGFSMGVNYGTNRVRFVAGVPVGSRIRAAAELTDVVEVSGGLQTAMTVTIEVESEVESDGNLNGKAACVIESISRWLY